MNADIYPDNGCVHCDYDYETDCSEGCMRLINEEKEGSSTK